MTKGPISGICARSNYLPSSTPQTKRQRVTWERARILLTVRLMGGQGDQASASVCEGAAMMMFWFKQGGGSLVGALISQDLVKHYLSAGSSRAQRSQ